MTPYERTQQEKQAGYDFSKSHPDSVTNNLPEILRVPETQWPTYTGRYRQLHPEPMDPFTRFKEEAQYKADNPSLFPNEGFGTTETSILGYDAFNRPTATRTSRTFGKTKPTTRAQMESQKLNETNDPSELLRASTDPQWLPATQLRALAKYRRITQAQNPGQVP